VIAAEYDHAAPFSGGLALVKQWPNRGSNSPETAVKVIEYYVDPEGAVVWKSQ
jgi:hypothetical protein